MTNQEREELENIMSALMILTFKEEVFDICMNIAMIDSKLREMTKKLNIPQDSDHEFLDLIFDLLPTIYKMQNKE